jgi:hypothetical protein
MARKDKLRLALAYHSRLSPVNKISRELDRARSGMMRRPKSVSLVGRYATFVSFLKASATIVQVRPANKRSIPTKRPIASSPLAGHSR